MQISVQLLTIRKLLVMGGIYAQLTICPQVSLRSHFYQPVVPEAAKQLSNGLQTRIRLLESIRSTFGGQAAVL